MKKKMAICLSGVHYIENMIHWSNKEIPINYKKYEKNIKTKIYDYFKTYYDIDTFFCTNMSVMFDELCKSYSPVKYCIENELGGNYKKLKVLELLLDYIKTSNKKYDTILLTRFDIYIIEQFANTNINYKLLNIVSELEIKTVCDDNLFIFPFAYLSMIVELMKQTNLEDRCSIHSLKDIFHKHFKINYIRNEPGKCVKDLSFFKLRFFNEKELILNNYLYSENVIYNSKFYSSDIIIHDNIITFNKRISNNDIYCWIGYEIKNTGLYNLTFEMFSNKNIINYDFIKLHKPIIFYKTKNILENVWTNIDITINVTEMNDLLCFIFDNFSDKIEILYKNISFKPI